MVGPRVASPKPFVQQPAANLQIVNPWICAQPKQGVVGSTPLRLGAVSAGSRCRFLAPSFKDDVARPRVYILDSLNILRHRNETDMLSPVLLCWSQLFSAAEFYHAQGHQVLAFLPRLHEKCTSELVHLKQMIQGNCIVTTPFGDCDDKFMINYARNELKRGYLARIVTNDKFRDHQVDKAWSAEVLVSYAFAAGRFVPVDIDR